MYITLMQIILNNKERVPLIVEIFFPEPCVNPLHQQLSLANNVQDDLQQRRPGATFQYFWEITISLGNI